MATTPNVGFDVLDPTDSSRLLIEFLQTHFGPDSTSTIMMLDQLIAELQQKEGFKVVESAEEPTDTLNIGDEWDKLL